MKNKMGGFTLLELMVVVVIIAILATFAMVNYSKYGYRARRADGKEALARVASAQERYYTNYNKYAATLTDLGFKAAPPCNILGASEKCYYVVTTANGASGDNSTYTLTGTPQAPSQNNDVCGNLTIDNTGQKLPAPNTMPANSNGSCW